MDGLTHPVGDQPPEVYWKRRLAVIVGIVVLALLVWWLFGALTGGSKTPGSTPGTTPGATTSPGSTVSAAPTVSADPGRACTEADVTLVTVPTKSDFAGTTEPTFTVTATQVGSTPCKLDTGADGTEMLIVSGSDRIFSSTDCTDDKTFEAKEYLLQPDDTQNIDLTWDRTRSEKGCGDVSAKPRPGTYKATVTIGDIAAEPATFTLS